MSAFRISVSILCTELERRDVFGGGMHICTHAHTHSQNWNDVMYSAIKGVGPFSVLYFVIVLLIGV